MMILCYVLLPVLLEVNVKGGNTVQLSLEAHLAEYDRELETKS